jgi:hypothetical protein
VIMRPNVASRFIGALLPQGARRRIRDTISRANVKRDEMPAAVRARLREELRGDILDLQQLIGRDLSPWLA